MNRPWQIWLAFSVAVAILVGAVGWLSVKAIQSEKAEIAAGQQARLDQLASLALWRMDSFVTPLVAQESARPVSAYGPLESDRKSNSWTIKGDQNSAFNAASSLSMQSEPNIVLHFLCDPKQFTCPDLTDPGQQATNQSQPSLSAQPLKESYFAGLRKNATFQLLADLCPAPDLITTVAPNPSSVVARSVPNPPARQMDVPQSIATGDLTQQSANANVEQVDPNSAPNAAAAQVGTADQQQTDLPKQALSQSGSFKRSQAEFQARSKSVVENSKSLQVAGFNNYDQGIPRGSVAVEVRMSTMTPHWIGNDLVLARRVDVESREYVQGCLLDWPGLKQQLIDEVADLLPHADLKPTSDRGEAADVRRLASLPVMLIAGALPIDTAVDIAGLSPIKQSLLIAWGAMALAALAAAALLCGVIALSERRAAFVSAVTHELRTPLTTFRMYAEMLSEGMVRGESDRRQYLETLRTEADRLTHLVANVLAYARLERGSGTGRCETINVSRLLEIATERLEDRTAQSQFSLSIEPATGVLSQNVQADPAAVEQILFNLVDNACKYAAAATTRTLHLTVSREQSRIWIRLRDHGAGIPSEEQRRLFKPFRKSARDAARSAPGVGLGLALSRRLARQMQGNLCYEKTAEGASFALSLPIAGGC